MLRQMLSGILLLHFVTSTMSQACTPGVNCKMPACRCPQDTSTPGGVKNPPQMVLVSFEDAFNSQSENVYSSILKDLQNPNGCPALGTYFVQGDKSDKDVIQKLDQAGHELGLSTFNGEFPGDNTAVWAQTFAKSKSFLNNQAHVTDVSINGARVPEDGMGGDAQMGGIEKNGLVYDSSCVTELFASADSMLWPYTYDLVDDTPKCAFGTTPKLQHKGIWQFVKPLLKVNSNPAKYCGRPYFCSQLLGKRSADKVHDFLYRNFHEHYRLHRTPFIIDVDTYWTAKNLIDGTKQFLQYIRSNFNDTWIVTHNQTLEWMKNPMSSDKATTFKPWTCK